MPSINEITSDKNKVRSVNDWKQIGERVNTAYVKMYEMLQTLHGTPKKVWSKEHLEIEMGFAKLMHNLIERMAEEHPEIDEDTINNIFSGVNE